MADIFGGLLRQGLRGYVRWDPELELDMKQWGFFPSMNMKNWQAFRFEFDEAFVNDDFPLISRVLAQRGRLRETLIREMNSSRFNFDIDARPANSRRELLRLYRRAYKQMRQFTDNAQSTIDRKGFNKWGFDTGRTFDSLSISSSSAR